MTPEQLSDAAGIAPGLAVVWAGPLTDAMRAYQITTPLRQAAFIGQLAHESLGFTRLEENLAYSASRLREIWPAKFPTDEAALAYAYEPEKIANYVYALRYGNGGVDSGDGWRFRGRGPIMLTFRDNYLEASFEILGTDRLVRFPEHVAESPLVGAAVSARFWFVKGCNELADARDYEGITRRINGGTIGLRDRLVRTQMALEAFA